MAVEFPFTCHTPPGYYFLNAGVLGTVDGEEIFLHRVLDIAAFQVQPESLHAAQWHHRLQRARRTDQDNVRHRTGAW